MRYSAIVSSARKYPPRKSPGPVVSFKEEPAGRDTLAAISDEYKRTALRLGAGRERTTTKHYGDRISNAPGAPSPKTARAMDTSPEVTVTFEPAGRETYAAMVGEHRREMPDIEIVTDEEDDELTDEEWLLSLEVEQIHTFVVRASIEQFDGPASRFQLVEKRLLTQIPDATIDQVSRVEVTRDSDESVLVRVWVAVDV